MNRFYLTDFRRSFRTSLLVIAILVLSFLGPLLSSVLRSSVEGFLQENARRILTADLAVGAYRPLTDADIQPLSERFEVRREVREIEFNTMAMSGAGSLIEVHGVEAGFPIEGEFLFKSVNAGAADSKELRGKAAMGAGEVWLTEDAMLALDLKLGDPLRLGRSEFKVTRVIEQAPGISRSGIGFAPKAYIAFEEARPTGLMGFGSQVLHRVYLETARAVDLEEAKKIVGDEEVFLRTPDESFEGIGRFTGFVSLYLAVVSVSLFTLGWAAAFYVIRVQAIERMKSAAIALVFGAGTKSLLRYELFRAIAMTVVAAFIAGGLVYAATQILEPLLAEALRKNVPGDFRIIVSWRDVLGLGITALLSSAIFTFPFADRLQRSRLVDLFKESTSLDLDDSSQDTEPSRKTAGRRRFAILALAAGALFGISIWLTRDAKRGAQLAAGFVFAAAVIHVSGIVIFRGLASVSSNMSGSIGSVLRIVGI
ncbi:MAG: hypothetical protein RBT63_04840, partial [Bdellovibrionales bacterium]|nr:hypothetical protein [Bdellovibrionales bacterium]